MQVLVVAIASLPLLTHGHDMAARPVQQAAVEPAPALPLSEYRYIFTNYRTETALYVLELLAKGPFRVVASRIAVPPEEANLVLELKPFGGPWQLGGRVTLRLIDSAGCVTGDLVGDSDWTGERGAARAAVRKLINGHRRDQEAQKRLKAVSEPSGPSGSSGPPIPGSEPAADNPQVNSDPLMLPVGMDEFVS